MTPNVITPPIHLMKSLNRVYMDEYSLEFVEQAMVDSLKVLRLPLAVCWNTQ